MWVGADGIHAIGSERRYLASDGFPAIWFRIGCNRVSLLDLFESTAVVF